MHRARQAWWWAMLALAAAACGGDESAPLAPPLDPPETALADAVDPSLLGSADRILTAVPDAQGRQVISPERARALAVAMIRTFGPSMRFLIDTGQPEPLRLEDLTASERVYFAESSHEPLPADVFFPHRKAYGPYYLLMLEQDGAPVTSVAVSAMATDIGIVDGEIRFLNLSHGNEFRVLPIPPGGETPISPETAVRLAADVTGRVVVEAPRILAPTIPGEVPQYGRWELTLREPVSVDTDSGSRLAAVVYVGHRGVVEVAASDQPAEWRQSVHEPEAGRARRDLPIRRRPGTAIRFERVLGVAR